MLLPIAVREAERLLCPICAQERRQRVYAASRQAWLDRSAVTADPALCPLHPRLADAAGIGQGRLDLALAETSETSPERTLSHA
jgi:hypothetical protein